MARQKAQELEHFESTKQQGEIAKKLTADVAPVSTGLEDQLISQFLSDFMKLPMDKWSSSPEEGLAHINRLKQAYFNNQTLSNMNIKSFSFT